MYWAVMVFINRDETETPDISQQGEGLAIMAGFSCQQIVRVVMFMSTGTDKVISTYPLYLGQISFPHD